MYICIYINHVQHNNNVYICIHILYIHMFIIFILYPFINDGYIYIYRSYITFLSIKTSFFLSLSRLSLYIPRHYLFIFLHFLTFSCTREPGFSIQFSAFARRMDECPNRSWKNRNRLIRENISPTCLEARGSFSKFVQLADRCIPSCRNNRES